MSTTHRILIVDDEPNVRLVLQTALESVGYRVAQAEDGRAAIERLRTSDYDLVVLDLQMPKMNGMEALRQLRERCNPVPVVMLTAHGSIPEAVAAMKLGAIDFLTKPITPEALRRVVAEVIRRHAEHPPSPPQAAPRPPSTPGSTPAERSNPVAVDLVRAKRALNRGEFAEAELLLLGVVALDPRSEEGHQLLYQLKTIKEVEGPGAFRILRDWFPSGSPRGKA